MIEESPARFLATETREQMFAAATQLGQKLKLLGAGTVEFLVPAAAQDQRANFYFLEINPRIQVEHPVTELVTGFDIVELQIRVARGEPLPFHQEQVRQIGSAIEARVCAEIPKQNFRPSGGKLSILDIPAPITTSKTNSVRFDHGLAQGISIPTEYDSLLLKAIAHGSNSIQAREELIRALSGLAIYRVETNIHFLLQLLRHQDFLEEPPITTDFIDRQPELFISPLPTEESAQIARIALSAYLALEPRLFQMAINKEIGRTERRREANLTSIARGPLRNFLIRCSAFATEQILRSRIQSEEYHEKGDLLRYFVDFLDSNAELDIRNNPLRLGQPFLIQLNKRTQSLTLLEHSLNDNLDIDATFLLEGLQIKLSRQINDCNDSLKISKASEVYAPLPGTVLKVLVKAGSPVQLGDTLLVLESMKMEHALHSPCNGIVAEIRIAQGDKVKDGDLLIRFTERT